jgi:hypothetical protein
VTRRAGSPRMVVRIPPGTLFEAGSGGVQNMVVTEGTSVDLTTAASAAFTAAVACSDLHLSVPGQEDNFKVAQLPPSESRSRKVLPSCRTSGGIVRGQTGRSLDRHGQCGLQRSGDPRKRLLWRRIKIHKRRGSCDCHDAAREIRYRRCVAINLG